MDFISNEVLKMFAVVGGDVLSGFSRTYILGRIRMGKREDQASQDQLPHQTQIRWQTSRQVLVQGLQGV